VGVSKEKVYFVCVNRGGGSGDHWTHRQGKERFTGGEKVCLPEHMDRTVSSNWV